MLRINVLEGELEEHFEVEQSETVLEESLGISYSESKVIFLT
jgi:hypothetical protein